MISKFNDSTVSFKARVGVDIGASNKNGSCKISLYDKAGQEISRTKTVVNTNRTGFFKNEEEFVTFIADRISENATPKALKKEGLSKVTIFTPGSTYKNTCLETPNLKDANGRSLANIDFSNISTLLEHRGIKINKNFKLNILQDSMGIGLSVLKDMAVNDVKTGKSDFLQPGKNYTVVMSGGGCGISHISVKDNSVDIKGSGSDVLSIGRKTTRISDIGASVKATLAKFAESIGLKDKEAQNLVDSGIGQVITDKKFVVKNAEPAQKLKNVLEKTNNYIIKQNGEEISFEIKPEFAKTYKKARTKTLNYYASAVAKLTPQILGSNADNGLIITGPFALGLDRCLKENYDSSMAKIVEKKSKAYITKGFSDKTKAYDFKIICDNTLAIEDNTDCLGILESIKTFGDRRNQLEISNLANVKKVLADSLGLIKHSV